VGARGFARAYAAPRAARHGRMFQVTWCMCCSSIGAVLPRVAVVACCRHGYMCGSVLHMWQCKPACSRMHAPRLTVWQCGSVAVCCTGACSWRWMQSRHCISSQGHAVMTARRATLHTTKEHGDTCTMMHCSSSQGHAMHTNLTRRETCTSVRQCTMPDCSPGT
jgi:hypothetical protein